MLGPAEGTVEDDRVKGKAEDECERVTYGEEDILVGLIYAARWRWRGGGERRWVGAQEVLEYRDADVWRNSG